MPESPRAFADIVCSRRSVRAPGPGARASDIRAVLEGAQGVPSNCDTQPWQVHVVLRIHHYEGDPP
ncbi:hypothetical protein [Nocardiopsis sp. L17-MgMaSL7]|uniref:hypothetical protein n=1 Tax=Nocardiopsis sp. L17-MgMaSL7 TaxID=1938893 RepID=UPI000D8F38B7|nr:hypothetical protein [Nocardiopsis sp. L17-MgMaSL7]PWV46813.1 hypothetical protein BDW27_113122 [Nocardiopsis sp. L17-MgMaSL7]